MKKSNFLLIAIALVVVTALVTFLTMKPEKKTSRPCGKTCAREGTGHSLEGSVQLSGRASPALRASGAFR